MSANLAAKAREGVEGNCFTPFVTFKELKKEGMKVGSSVSCYNPGRVSGFGLNWRKENSPESRIPFRRVGDATTSKSGKKASFVDLALFGRFQGV